MSRNGGRFSWIARGGRVVLLARALRSFAQGMLSVLLALFLIDRGVTLSGVGLFLSAGVIGGAVYALALYGMAARIGRRRSLIVLTGLSSGASIALLASGDL
ncbi:MAG: hypothetical protein JRE70_20965, partial [Deltaproteobacteria bacterium]|nr:hypothetical protein [Deltaproteobacteria bacterium]